jgi:hypothetical protein
VLRFLKTPFGLLIWFITISITRNYNHSQLFITLCHIYTAYNHTRSWLQSHITLVHWLTSQLSVTVSNYHRLYIFTLRNSRRDLTPRIHPLLNNSSRELLLTNCWLLRHSSSSYITLNRRSVTVAWKGCLRSVSEQRARWELCYVTRGTAQVTSYSPTPVPSDIIAACCVGTLFQYCCVTSSRLRGNLVYRSVN